MNRIFGTLIAVVVISGCATSQQQIDSHAPALNSWVGAPIAEFVAVQGTPTAVVEEGNYQIYEFDTSKTKNVSHTGEHCQPTNFNEPIDEYGRPGGCRTVQSHWYTVTFSCTYGLVVLEDVITDWSMDGNNCRMVTVHGRAGLAEPGRSLP